MTFYLLRLYQCPPHRLAVTCMPIQSKCFASPWEHIHQECSPPPSKWQQLTLCMIKCVSGTLHVCGLSPQMHLAPIPQKPKLGNSIWVVFFLNSGARAAQHLPALLREGNLSSRRPITVTSLTAAVVVNKRQAFLVLQRYRWKAARARNADDAQTASPLQQEPSSHSTQSRS